MRRLLVVIALLGGLVASRSALAEPPAVAEVLVPGQDSVPAATCPPEGWPPVQGAPTTEELVGTDFLPSTTTGALQFYFVRFLRSAPADLAVAFPSADPTVLSALGAVQNEVNEFQFSPGVTFGNAVDDAGFGLIGYTGSALWIKATGTHQRTFAVGGTSNQVIANSAITVVTATTEGFLVPCGDTPDGKQSAHDWRLSCGLHYAAIQQEYDLTLIGTATRALHSTQNFAGLGPTLQIEDRYTVGLGKHRLHQKTIEPLKLYGLVRASALFGENSKSSKLTENDATVFSTSQASSELIPFVEVQAGLTLSNEPSPATYVGLAQQRQPLPAVMFLRIGLVGQYWGGVGLPSAATSDVAFQDRDLFVVGALLQLEIQSGASTRGRSAIARALANGRRSSAGSCLAE